MTMLAASAVGVKKSIISMSTLSRLDRLEFQLLDAGETQKIIGDAHQPLAFRLQLLHASQGPPFALVLRVLKVLGQELQIQPQRAQMVLDLMDEAAGQLGQQGVAVVFGHVPLPSKNHLTLEHGKNYI